MNYLFFICDTLGFLRIMYFVKTILSILGFVIPFILIVFTTIDIYKGIINPDNKDIVKKIGFRVGAAVIVFIIPMIIPGVLSLFDFVGSSDYKVSKCYVNGTSECLDTITSYLNCEGFDGNEKKECKEYRTCNSYTLDDTCHLTTIINSNNCSNLDDVSYKYSVNNYKYEK